MAKVKARKRRPKKQSLSRNVALLFLSLVVLAGTSFLFSMVNPRHAYVPIEKSLNKLVAKPQTGQDELKREKEEPQNSAVGTYDYTYWDYLFPRNSIEKESYSIQIASFRTREAASQYTRDLSDKTRVRATVENRGGSFVVRWGSFSNREIAERYCGTLSSRIQKDCSVMKL